MDFESDFDLYQEIARSGFGDMLHDHERNRKYYIGLEKAIKTLRNRNVPVRVLDLGTGSGMLSMMAVKLKADSVTACEAFRPMADCAEKIFKKNGVRDKIQLLKKRSTEIKIGEDMKERANILVTEVFDTELIGEGAIEIFNHAHRDLLEKDCIVVPNSARIFVTLVESPLLDSFNRPKSIADLDGEVLLNTPKKFFNCPGTTSLFDVQLSQFPVERFKQISKPQHVLSFDFSGKDAICKSRKVVQKIQAQVDGSVHALFFWWDLQMDVEGETVISCAPYWAHPDFISLREIVNNSKVLDKNVIPWRDHWMQAIYFPPNYVPVTKNEEIFLVSNHGQYSWWFNVVKSEKEAENALKEPFCACGLHHFCSRYRVGQMNQSLRTKEYIKFYEESIGRDSVVLAISHGSLICLSAAALKPKILYYFDSTILGRRLLDDYVEENKLENVKVISTLDEVPFTELTTIIAEPHFSNDILPWSSLEFFNCLRRIKSKLPEKVTIFPSSVSLFMVPVEFLDLHKIRKPMLTVETFDVSHLDELLAKAYDMADDNFEPHSLWEYPCKALSEQSMLYTIDLKDFLEDAEADKVLDVQKGVPMKSDGNFNGIVVWTTWNSKKYLTTGPTVTPVPGDLIQWDLFSKQGVYFVKRPMDVHPNNEVKVNFKFNPVKLFLDCAIFD